MENASKAMIIVAGVLIGVMILTLGATLFTDLTRYVQSSQEAIRFNELNAFNTQFLKYTGETNLTIHDVVTAANLANQNNISYDVLTDEQVQNSRGNPSSMYVAVYLDGSAIESNIQDINHAHGATQLLGTKFERQYQCIGVEISNVTGRVYKIRFKEN